MFEKLWPRRWRRRKDWRDDGRDWQPLGSAGFAPRPEPLPAELAALYRDTAYYCANLNARAVARAPLRLFVRTLPGQPAPKCAVRPVHAKLLARIAAEPFVGRPIGRDETIDEVESHPILTLLDRPVMEDGASLLSRFELFEWTQLSLEIAGRAYWRLRRDRLGAPIGVWPLPAHLVRVEPDREAGRAIARYVWTGGAQEVSLARRDVIAFRLADLADPLAGGVSPACAAFGRLGIANLLLDHVRAVLENRARPELVISPAHPDAILGEAEARRLEEAFRRRFRGDGSGGVHVARDGLKLEPIAYPPRDLADAADQQASFDQIARAFDIPLSMLSKDANRASAEQGRAQHAGDAVAPRLLRLADRLNQQLVPAFDPSGRLFLRFDDPAIENLALKLKQRAAHLRLGFTTINEERAEEGWAPVPWGDVPLPLQPVSRPDACQPEKEGSDR